MERLDKPLKCLCGGNAVYHKSSLQRLGLFVDGYLCYVRAKVPAYICEDCNQVYFDNRADDIFRHAAAIKTEGETAWSD